MKYVQVPKPIQIIINGELWKDSEDNVMPPWTIGRYLEDIVFPDPSIGTSYKALTAVDDMSKQFKDAAAGSVIGVESAHWDLLNKAIENPKGTMVGISAGAVSIILRQLLPFAKAIIKAADEKPKSDDKANGDS